MIAGMSFIKDLGLSKLDLVPVHTQIKSANKSDICIIGAVIVEIKLWKANTECFYVIDVVYRVFFSLEACMQLGLIDKLFPYQEVEGAAVN